MELTKDFIKEEIASKFNFDASQINDDTRLKEDIKADSIDLFQLVMEYEEKLGITLEDEVLMQIKTVGDLYKALGLN
ncbi:MAG: acyl carrier protein [Mycoplasmatales bacterium]